MQIIFQPLQTSLKSENESSEPKELVSYLIFQHHAMSVKLDFYDMIDLMFLTSTNLSSLPTPEEM